MPPKRQPAKRKAAPRGDDQDSDYSGGVLAVANKKAKRSERKPARRSPRVQSEDEDKPTRTGRTGRLGRDNEASDDDGFSSEDGGLEMLNQAALQRKTSQKEAKKSKEFLMGFQKKQKVEEKELTEFAQGKMADIEDVSKRFSEQFSTKYSKFLKQGSQPSHRRANPEAQPLRKDMRQTLSLCQDVLQHYKSTNGPGKGAELKLNIRSNDQDKKDVLEVIDRGRQLGEKIITAAVSPSAGDGPLVPEQPASVTDELVAGFFETSLGRAGENLEGKGAWGLWMALDKVVKRLQKEAN